MKYFTVLTFLVWFSSYKSFTKNNGAWYRKYSLNICSFIFFSLFLVQFKNFSRNFDEDMLLPDFAFLVLGAGLGVGLGAGSDVGI